MILAMDGSFLSPTAKEQQYYSSLFSTLDTENTGRVNTGIALEFFQVSKLSQEVLYRVTEICGANRLGHFGRSQFYIALKLIAMAQNMIPLPVSKEMMAQGIEVPLPNFGSNPDTWTTTSKDQDDQMEFINPAFIDLASDRGGGGGGGHASSGKHPPADWHVGPVVAVPSPMIGTPGPVRGVACPAVGVPGPVIGMGGPVMGVPGPVIGMGGPAIGVPGPVIGMGGPVMGVVGSKSSPHPAVFHHPDSVSAISPTQPAHSTPLKSASSPPPSSPLEPSPFNDATPISSPPHPVLHSKVIERHKSLPSPRDLRPATEKSVTDVGWASFDERDELGERRASNPTSNSTDTSWAKFPENRPSTAGSHSDAVCKESASEDVWLITPEQREYYTKQFKTLPPGPTGLLHGPVLKEFFEKSKLPTNELSKIWQLSDVNKDGTLSLPEFCTAMHLVVARKHKVDLPDKLPPSLVPILGTQQEEGQTYMATFNPPSQATPARSVTPPTPSTRTEENWANFPASSPSSQSPANFDFASISPDPEAKIFQPIARHVAPDGKTVTVAAETERKHRTLSDPLRAEGLSEEEATDEADTVFKKRSATVGERDTLTKIAPPPPVERARKGDSLERGVLGMFTSHSAETVARSVARSRSRSYSGANLKQRKPSPLTSHTEYMTEPPGSDPPPLPPHRGNQGEGEEEGEEEEEEEEEDRVWLPPPALPPRYNRAHLRSMSLDRNQLASQLPERLILPPRPTVPPRPGTQVSSHSSDQTHSSASSNCSSSEEEEVEAVEDLPDFANFSLCEGQNTVATELLTTAHGDYVPMDEVSPGISPPPPPPRHSQGDENTPSKSKKQHVTSPQLTSKDRHKSTDMLIADDRRAEFAKDRTRHTSAPQQTGLSSDLVLCDRRSIQAAIRRAKEENTKLSRLNSELQQELTQIKEERLSLEIELKKIRPPFAAAT